MNTPRQTADIVKDLRTVAKDTEALAVHTTNSTRHKNEMVAARLMTEAANRLEAAVNIEPAGDFDFVETVKWVCSFIASGECDRDADGNPMFGNGSEGSVCTGEINGAAIPAEYAKIGYDVADGPDQAAVTFIKQAPSGFDVETVFRGKEAEEVVAWIKEKATEYYRPKVTPEVPANMPDDTVSKDKLREALIVELTERRDNAEQYAKETHDGGYLWCASPWCFSPAEWADAVLERLATPAVFRPADKPISPEVYHNKPGNGGIFTARSPKGIAVQIGDEVLHFEVREAYYKVSRKEGGEPFEMSYESQSEAVAMFERLIGAAYLRAKVPAWVRFNGVQP